MKTNVLQQRKKPTIWVFLAVFPSYTASFLIRRIQGLIARGFDVHIIAEERKEGREGLTLAPDQAELMPLARWSSPEKPGILTAFSQTRQLSASHPPAAWQAWNLLRFRQTAGPRLLNAALAVRGLPPPDVVLGCFGPYGELACGLRSLGVFSAPVVTSFHGVDVYAQHPSHLRRRYRLVRQRGDLYLPVSQHLANRLLESGIDPRRMQVLHSPIRCSQFPWRAPKEVIGGQPVGIIGLGRLAEKKGFADSLRVIAALVASRRNLIYHLHGDGPQRAKLERLAEELGISAYVRFHGRVPHGRVVEIMGGGHLFLSTNRMAANGDCEGIPNTVKEALAVGLPVVATRHSGTPELISDGQHGLLADEGDIAGLAAACQRMLDDHALAVRCATAGRARVESEFDEGALNDRLAELLIEQIRQARSRGDMGP